MSKDRIRDFIKEAYRRKKEQNMEHIYIVTYFDKSEREPVVTAFDNRDAAERCYEAFKDKHDIVSIDRAPVYKSFEVL